MNRKEAMSLLNAKLEEYRKLGYDGLAARVGGDEFPEVVGVFGTKYQIEILIRWDGNFADHMLGDEFREGADRLLAIAITKRTAIMCAEKPYHDCHRKLTSDFLVANSITVQHILPDDKLELHKLSEAAKVGNGRLTYPESLPLFD